MDRACVEEEGEEEYGGDCRREQNDMSKITGEKVVEKDMKVRGLVRNDAKD